MKKLVVVILCSLALGASSQTKTGEVKELSVYGRDGKTLIAKVMADPNTRSNLFLIKSVQKKDSASNYLTHFYVGNKETGPLLNIRLVLKFNKPVNSVEPSFTTSFNNVNGLSDDHQTYLFKAGRLERDSGSAIVISFIIKSRERIVTEITGLDGILQ